ncbi:MAG: hypothetical protein ABIN89_15580 [Chitinophagaceae bacterium]
MTIEQFKLLNDSEKEQAVWRDGVFLSNYDEWNSMFEVYKLFNFYVSFCYQLDKNEMAEITAYVYLDELPLLIKAYNLN